MKIENILEQRGQVHGDFDTQSACSQSLKDVVRYYAAQRQEPLAPQDMETLEMLCVKMSRAVVGDPMHEDHWDDMAGYSTRNRQSIQQRKTLNREVTTHMMVDTPEKFVEFRNDEFKIVDKGTEQ